MLNRSPFQQINASALTLTGSLATVPAQVSAGGDGGAPGTGAVPLGGLAFASLAFDYARNGGSTTGRPCVMVKLSRDPLPTPGQSSAVAAAAVTHWCAVQVIDGSVFVVGQVDAYPEQVNFRPSVTGTSTFSWPGAIDVRGFTWIQVQAMDFDGTNSGTLVAYLGGSV